MIDTTISTVCWCPRSGARPWWRTKMRALQQGIMSHVYPHRLRHSFASHVLQSSQDLRAVQELMATPVSRRRRLHASGFPAHLAKVYDQAHLAPASRT